MKFEAQLDGMVLPVEVTGSGGRYHLVPRPEDPRYFGFAHGPDSAKRFLFPARELLLEVRRDAGRLVVDESPTGQDPERYAFVGIRTRGGTAGAGGQVLKAPMPGRVVLVEVALGQAVQPGDGLVILEAMKMENEFKATVAGSVKEIRVESGQIVNPGDVLLVIE